jgi:DNA-binding IclR family transcriptional regulator
MTDEIGGRSQSKSTERAAAILACFTPEHPRLRVSEFSEKIGVHPTTVWRYLSSLEEANLVEHDESSGTYRLGLGVLRLSSLVLSQLEVRRHGLEEIDHVRDEFGVLVNLGLLRGGDVIHVAHAFPDNWPKWNMDLGEVAVSQCTALGKVLLAALPWEEALGRVVAAGWRPYTANSITDAATLRRELAEVAEGGFAVDREERKLGTMCVAVPVLGADGEVVAAISASGRDGAVGEIGIDRLVDVLATVARRISVRMGARDGHISYF